MASFRFFYVHHFRPEHAHPANIGLHLFGVLASGVLVLAAPWTACPWLVLAYPIVHAGPGLLGHRLFERNLAVGDVRLDRTDFPLWWFIIGNHILLAEVLFRRQLVRKDR